MDFKDVMYLIQSGLLLVYIIRDFIREWHIFHLDLSEVFVKEQDDSDDDGNDTNDIRG